MSKIEVNTIDTVDNTALTIKQNDTTAMTINTSKQIGIGTTSPNKDGITKALTINSPVATNYSGLELSTADTLRTALISNSNGGFLYTATDIPLVFQTNNVERARFTSAGLHLGGTGSANALDDYEEGTWSPTFSGESGGASGVSFATRVGFYTKIGNLVFISVDLEISSWSSGPSGNLIISTLPFTSSGSNYQSAIAISRVSGFTSTGAPSGGRIASSATTIKLVKKASSDARDNMVTAVSSSDASGNERITLTGFYQTDS